MLVTPDDPVWIDVWIPHDDSLWRADVARAFDWLGDTWCSALGNIGITDVSANRGGSVACTRWSSLICFGGVGTGEVITADGRKVVGLSQRRTRDGSWFHGACVRRWDPDPLLDVLAMSAQEREVASADLTAAVCGIADLRHDVPDNLTGLSAVADAFMAALPGEP